MAYFDAQLLPNAKNEYVCFIDILGIQNKMKQSLQQSANYMFKLHSTILEAWRTTAYNCISVYPIMDGAYITSRKKNEMLNLLTRIYQELGKSLIRTEDFKHWYLVRASLAFGPIIHGRDIPYKASYEFSSRVGYKEQLLIGEPIVKAYLGESKSAPMGIYIDESVLNAGKHHLALDWKWYNNTNIKCYADEVEALKIKLGQYYNWIKNDRNAQNYPAERQEAHYSRLEQYYSDIDLS